MKIAVRCVCILGLVALLATVEGCGGSSVGGVTGVVTLDNEPLPDALVTFQPEQGRPSTAMTDEQGRYELQYSATEAGAAIGKHKVTITTAITREKGDGSSDVIMAEERVPAKYNKQTELTEEVKSGKNEIDFSLTSQ